LQIARYIHRLEVPMTQVTPSRPAANRLSVDPQPVPVIRADMHDKRSRLPFQLKRPSEMIHPIVTPADPRTTDPGRRPSVLQQRRIDRGALRARAPWQPDQATYQPYSNFSHGNIY